MNVIGYFIVDKELKKIFDSGEPYFGPFIQADQGSMYFKYFADVIKLVENRPLTILEIGSWAGGSLIAWDKAAEGQANLISVDSWGNYPAGYLPGSDAVKAADCGAIYQLFEHNVKVTGVVNRLQVLRGNSNDILPTLPDDSVDIVFIDGDHRYEQTKSDINNSIRLIRKGGVLCGDDMQVQYGDLRDKDACHQAILADKEYTLDSNGGVGYHPGVSFAVWEKFGRVHLFSDGSADETRLWMVQDPKYRGEVNYGNTSGV